MEGYSGRGNSSSEDMATWLFAFEDELYIVGEGIMDDIAGEGHLGLPLPSVPFSPIVECVGFLKTLWVNLEVIFVNHNGVAMAEGICHNTHPQDCIDENPFGIEDVGVLILESLIDSKVDPIHRFSFRKWPLRNVMINGVSLCEHERQHMQI